MPPRMLKSLHALARRQLWWWALLLGLTIGLGWILNSWHSGWQVTKDVVLGGMALVLIWLFVAGLLEWKSRDKENG